MRMRDILWYRYGNVEMNIFSNISIVLLRDSVMGHRQKVGLDKGVEEMASRVESRRC